MGFSFKDVASGISRAATGGVYDFTDSNFGLPGGVADMIPGIGDARAQDRANQQNISLYNANQRWMEMMSNTAYQRAMADMKKSGLNPILAYQQGGASTPSSTAPTVQASSKTGLVDSALKAYTGISAAHSQSQQANSAQAQVESTKNLQAAQTAKEVATTRNIEAETKLKTRELRGKGVRETLDIEGGTIIQKLIDSIGTSSAKDSAVNQQAPKSSILDKASQFGNWLISPKPKKGKK